MEEVNLSVVVGFVWHHTSALLLTFTLVVPLCVCSQ